MIVVAMDNENQPPNPSWSSSSPVRGGGEGEGERGKVENEEVAQSSSHQDQKAKAAKLKPNPTFLGRHRMNAAISHLNTQINIIEKELNELETVGDSSIVCQELISSLETIPDPLLPTTKGPADVSWDRWFRGAHNSRSHKRWM
ncbi:guanine nucleotide-binding protein subunit gamma 1-like isoform X1 [Humulus lupulus]|uniref:guanine nucleotide-binding protein subunit gamma 1-like isoform X1 n=1 Tax=Humulus lupulus TaxID=3486 RepID=UPI002B403D1A|nr:guanine nucleotide-binding protein subunit gamma 1-like isoform X1 [Humulus lupulus]